MDNSNIPSVPLAPQAPGLSNPDIANVPPVDNIKVENIAPPVSEAVVPPSEIPVTYAEKVEFGVPINPAPPVPVVAPPETPLAQPVSPIVGTDGPTNKMVRDAEPIYDKEALNTDDLFKISDQLYPPIQE